MRTPRRKSQRGFTLVELMISLVLFSFAIAGVLAVAVSMAQGYREQRMIIATEGAARGAVDYIADALRMASPGIRTANVVTSTATDLVVGTIEDTESGSATCQLGSVRITNRTTAPDELEIVYASGGTVTSLGAPWTAGGANLTLNDTSNFAIGDRILVTDGTNGHIAKITNIAGAAVTVATGACALNATPTYATAGSLVIRVLRARFKVGTFDGIGNTLTMDPDGDGAASAEPLADNVEDFQVAAGIDEGGTADSIDATEWAFSGVVGTPATFTVGKNLHAVRITLVVKAATALSGTTPSFYRPSAEDHPQGSTLDAKRRRVLHSTAELRNLGVSP